MSTGDTFQLLGKMFTHEWSSKEDEEVRKRRKHVERYADAMKNSQICLMDSSVYKYALMNYVEATMAGCLIIADIPHDYPDMYICG